MNNELSGSLEGVGLPAIVRFLAGLHKTGRLTIAKEQFSGDVFFESGRVVVATFGSRRGLSALDALTEAMPDGSFTFSPVDPSTFGEHNVDLAPDELQVRLDDVANRTAAGTTTLPPLTAVPLLVDQPEPSPATDTLLLDRGTLQTLLAVDGKRTVREIVSSRATFETLWHLAKLAEIGLIRFDTSAALPVVENTAASMAPTPIGDAPTMAGRSGAPLPVTPAPGEPRAPYTRPAPSVPAAAAGVSAATAASAAPTAAKAAAAGAPARSGSERQTAVAQCPKLGFQDDPNSSFDRPTRLHRCFASNTPAPLSIDQQRELCLSDRYPTCPRFIDAARAAPGGGKDAARAGVAVTTAAVAGAGAIGAAASASPTAPERPATSSPGTPASDPSQVENDPRIVRLPTATPAAERQAVGYPPPSRGRPSTEQKASDPTPLRARVAPPTADTPTAAATAAGTSGKPAAATAAVSNAPAAAPKTGRMADAGPRLAVAGVVVIVVGLIGFLMLSQLLAPAPDTDDLSFLGKDAGAIAAGTPPAQVQNANATAVAQATARAAAQPANPPAPTAVPTPAEAPKPAVQPPAPAPTVAPTPPPAPTVGPRLLLDEQFANNQRGWVNNPEGTAWLSQGVYNLMPRLATQFVAVAAPQVQALRDVIVNATFRKVDGPNGGGYGIIVRDQGPGPRDGVNQGGQYYVLEVGDRGEVGIWRRDGDRWVDLVTWQATPLVRPGTGTNDLSVRAVGDRLSLSVNGQEAAVANDATIPSGGVGVFVGGDNNQVALERFSVQPAE